MLLKKNWKKIRLISPTTVFKKNGLTWFDPSQNPWLFWKTATKSDLELWIEILNLIQVLCIYLIGSRNWRFFNHRRIGHKVRPLKFKTFEAQKKSLHGRKNFYLPVKFLFLYNLGPSRSPCLTEISFIFLEAPSIQ